MNIELTTAGSRPPARRTGTLILPLFLANFLAVGLLPRAGPAVDGRACGRSPAAQPPCRLIRRHSTVPARAAHPPAAGQTQITITIAETVIMARLADNPNGA